MRSTFPLARLTPFALALLTATACSKLTEPPKEEPISGDLPAAEAKQADTRSAHAPNAPGGGGGPGEKFRPLHEAQEAAQNGNTAPSKVQITELAPGSGAVAKKGDTVSVHYTGTLADGKEFDSSRKPGRQPIDFTLGKPGIIEGWQQGIEGMKVGQKRKLVIPPELAYGPRGKPPVIPPNATLTFEVELVAVKAGQ